MVVEMKAGSVFRKRLDQLVDCPDLDGAKLFELQARAFALLFPPHDTRNLALVGDPGELYVENEFGSELGQGCGVDEDASRADVQRAARL